MLYPYKFTPILVERVWGGQTLSRFGKALPPGKRIGETWEISDRPDALSIVANGPDRGKTLRQLIEAYGYEAVVGRVTPRGAASGDAAYKQRFPLLVKLLDARERLSLQVHPPPEIAAKLKGEPKTEMWYVFSADRDAQLIAGFRRGVTGADFIRAIEWAQGQHAASPPPKLIEDCVYRVPVAEGDTFFVPSGRIHAIDKGVALVEIQQNSDTTYRVYDWGRVGLDGKPRAVHIQEAITCANFQDFEPKKPQPRVETVSGGNGLWRLVECEHFHVHKLELRNAWLDRCDGTSFHILACVNGELGILTADGKEERLAVGEFILLPAALGHYTLTPLTERAEVLKTFLPK